MRLSTVSVQEAGKDFCLLEYINIKVKVTLEQATKAQRGSRGITLRFL
jgi:hypothetical protein